MKNNQKRAIFILFSCQTAQNIIEVGKRLIQAKSLVNHGHWQDWLQNNFQLGQSAANKFMSVAERFANSESIPILNSTQMIQLLALPDAAETEKFLAEKATEGKKVDEMTNCSRIILVGKLFNVPIFAEVRFSVFNRP